MNIIPGIFRKKKVDSVQFYIQNDECLKLIDEIRHDEKDNIQSVIIIWEDKNQETYWKVCGMETIQAIASLDQLHHRIQHEGLPGYD